MPGQPGRARLRAPAGQRRARSTTGSSGSASRRSSAAARAARSSSAASVRPHKGVNLPGVPLPIPSLTRKDLDDLEFALELGVDFVALSFVRSASDVAALRTLIEARGSHARVIAKIEKAEAVAALDEILARGRRA